MADNDNSSQAASSWTAPMAPPEVGTDTGPPWLISIATTDEPLIPELVWAADNSPSPDNLSGHGNLSSPDSLPASGSVPDPASNAPVSDAPIYDAYLSDGPAAGNPQAASPLATTLLAASPLDPAPVAEPQPATHPPPPPPPPPPPEPLRPSPPPPTQPAGRSAAQTISPLSPAAHRVDLPEAVRGLLDTDGTAVVILRLDGTIDTINAPMLSILGADSMDDLADGAAPSGLLRSFLDHLPQELLHHQDGQWHGDFDHRLPTGELRLLRATARVEGPTEHRPRGTIALLLHDVTAARKRVANLHHQASHDPLTGLANRQRIMADLARAIGEQRGRSGHVATIFIDLDHLKYVNDAFGHRVGDQLITSTAQRLAQAIRPNDRVARIGGDEFVVVSTDIADAMSALDLAERARRALTGHLRIGELDLAFSVSIGIALTDPDVLDLDDIGAAGVLVGNADTAMYEAKQTGRGRCTLFTSHMRIAARERTETAATLAHAVANNDLTVDYQPIFSTVTKSAVGAEALVRWTHPTRGRMDPSTFIAIAEESGIIGRLGEQVLDQAMSDLRTWIDRGTVPSDFSVHVNVSRVQLGSASFVNLVMAKLRENSLEPAHLVLEARETSLLGRIADVDRSIRALRRFGVQVAVDNFGTGPKALAVMTDVGADVLKLDGSLALPTGSSDAEIRLVRAIVLLAHALDMGVVAERVSGYEQLRRLQAAGCDMVQGNLLGSPCSADAIRVNSAIDW